MDIIYSYVVIALALVLQVAQLEAGHCSYTREYKMLGANCYDLGLDEIPQNLRDNIEILYAARNRFRMLTNTSLQKYSSLRFLYLGNNFITKIEPGAFSDLSDLEVLDLTWNSIRSLPTDLPLPLRKLYLAKNPDLGNISLTATFNLEYLTLAESDLKQVPAVGVLPNLKDLNLTVNPLINVTPADLAPFCRLERLYLPISLYKQPGVQAQCQCHRLLTWTSQHYISLPGFNCTSLEDPDAAACEVDFSEEIKVYKACLVAVPASTTRLLLYAVLGTALLLAVIIIICWWRKSRRKKNSVQDQKRTDKNTKAADTLIT